MINMPAPQILLWATRPPHHLKGINCASPDWSKFVSQFSLFSQHLPQPRSQASLFVNNARTCCARGTRPAERSLSASHQWSCCHISSVLPSTPFPLIHHALCQARVEDAASRWWPDERIVCGGTASSERSRCAAGMRPGARTSRLVVPTWCCCAERPEDGRSDAQDAFVVRRQRRPLPAGCCPALRAPPPGDGRSAQHGGGCTAGLRLPAWVSAVAATHPACGGPAALERTGPALSWTSSLELFVPIVCRADTVSVLVWYTSRPVVRALP